MIDTDKYLTEKAKASTATELLENAVVIVLLLLMTFLVCVAVCGYQRDGYHGAHLLICGLEGLLLLLLNRIMDRKRARRHAERIVDALMMRVDGRIACEELEAICGRWADQRAVQLVEKGYLTGVELRNGFVCLVDLP